MQHILLSTLARYAPNIPRRGLAENACLLAPAQLHFAYSAMIAPERP